ESVPIHAKRGSPIRAKSIVYGFCRAGSSPISARMSARCRSFSALESATTLAESEVWSGISRSLSCAGGNNRCDFQDIFGLALSAALCEVAEPGTQQQRIGLDQPERADHLFGSGLVFEEVFGLQMGPIGVL